MANDYRKVWHSRVQSGAAKAPSGGTGRITFDSPNVVDETKPPKVPAQPEQPVLPIDDAFRKMRTQKA